MRNSIIVFTMAGILDAMNQLIRLDRFEEQSWLPNWVYTWDFNWWVVDAWHFYQGAALTLVGLGAALLALHWADAGRGRKQALQLGFSAWVYYYIVIRNTFMHIILLYPEYWRIVI